MKNSDIQDFQCMPRNWYCDLILNFPQVHWQFIRQWVFDFSNIWFEYLDLTIRDACRISYTPANKFFFHSTRFVDCKRPRTRRKYDRFDPSHSEEFHVWGEFQLIANSPKEPQERYMRYGCDCVCRYVRRKSVDKLILFTTAARSRTRKARKLYLANKILSCRTVLLPRVTQEKNKYSRLFVRVRLRYILFAAPDAVPSVCTTQVVLSVHGYATKIEPSTRNWWTCTFIRGKGVREKEGERGGGRPVTR